VEIKVAYRNGILQANLLTHHEWVHTDRGEKWINRLYEAYLSAMPTARLTLEAGKKRIHAQNLINFGIVPLTFTRPSDWDEIEPGDRLRMDNPTAGQADTLYFLPGF
jgi:hypothetical protein